MVKVPFHSPLPVSPTTVFAHYRCRATAHYLGRLGRTASVPLLHTFQRSLSRSGPSGSAWRGRQRVPKSPVSSLPLLAGVITASVSSPVSSLPVSSLPLLDHPGAAEVNNIFVWMWNGQDKVCHSGLEP